MLSKNKSPLSSPSSSIFIVITPSIIFFSLIFFGFSSSSYQPVEVWAHISGNRTQEWVSQSNGIKILFTYEPEKPIIDTFTQLKFSVLNLTSNEHIKNFLARVVITDDQRIFKFENISVPDGDFSVRYMFPDDGTHQVIAKVNKGSSPLSSVIVVASFNVFVPHQPPPSILNPFPTSPGDENNAGFIISKILTIALPVAGVISLIIVIRKSRPTTRKEKE